MPRSYISVPTPPAPTVGSLPTPPRGTAPAPPRTQGPERNYNAALNPMPSFPRINSIGTAMMQAVQSKLLYNARYARREEERDNRQTSSTKTPKLAKPAPTPATLKKNAPAPPSARPHPPFVSMGELNSAPVPRPHAGPNGFSPQELAAPNPNLRNLPNVIDATSREAGSPSGPAWLNQSSQPPSTAPLAAQQRALAANVTGRLAGAVNRGPHPISTRWLKENRTDSRPAQVNSSAPNGRPAGPMVRRAPEKKSIGQAYRDEFFPEDKKDAPPPVRGGKAAPQKGTVQPATKSKPEPAATPKARTKPAVTKETPYKAQADEPKPEPAATKTGRPPKPRIKPAVTTPATPAKAAKPKPADTAPLAVQQQALAAHVTSPSYEAPRGGMGRSRGKKDSLLTKDFDESTGKPIPPR